MMLCTPIKDLSKIKEDKYLFELKKDGVRCLIMFDGTNLKMVNRRKADITNRYPEVAKSLKVSLKEYVKEFEVKLVTLDGELCCKDFNTLMSREHLTDNFKIGLMSKKYPATYYAFDILCLDKITADIGLLNRKKMLYNFQENNNFKVLEWYRDLETTLKLMKEQNEEGIILKEIDSKYEFDVRSDKWLKMKKRVEKIVDFNSYEMNIDNSLTLTNGFHRVKCNDMSVRGLIDEYGSVKAEVEGLEFTEKGHIRMPVIKRLV